MIRQAVKREESIMEISKKDWKLFRERIGDWQERYMEKLISKYIKQLSSDKPASVKFWDLEKRIKRDKKNPGVMMELNKGDMDLDLARLIKLKVIGFDDLEGFSDELIERVRELGGIFR